MKNIFLDKSYWKILKPDFIDFNDKLHERILFYFKLPFGFYIEKRVKPTFWKANILNYNCYEVLKMADKLNIKVKLKDLCSKEVVDFFKAPVIEEGHKYIEYCENSQGFRIGNIEETWMLYNRYKVDHFEAYGALKFCSLGYSSRRKTWTAWLDGEFKTFKCAKPADAKKKAVVWFMQKYLKSQVIHLL